ncbi:cupin domain-containing protein [Pseudomonas sp. Irchel s3f7]|uniref:cupin domain-containing protein n=1 Tax=Pseudomonas sp. Irchel s3f7 TaxID=2009153 RepID=UPI000BA4383C|nr:cupin domain-containing protein [Pseudomonas sp. Irchel s3f7]
MSELTVSYKPVRRIVTGHDENGQSIFLSDADALNVVAGAGRPVAQVLWATGEGRAAGDEPAPEGHKFAFHSEGGSLLRIVDFPPDETYNQEELVEFLDEEGVRDQNKPRHFWFHKTESLDYAVVLEGEIYAMLDQGERLMEAGDVLIQRATNHSWSNRSGKNCRMLFVLLALQEGEPL